MALSISIGDNPTTNHNVPNTITFRSLRKRSEIAMISWTSAKITRKTTIESGATRVGVKPARLRLKAQYTAVVKLVRTFRCRTSM